MSVLEKIEELHRKIAIIESDDNKILAKISGFAYLLHINDIRFINPIDYRCRNIMTNIPAFINPYEHQSIFSYVGDQADEYLSLINELWTLYVEAMGMRTALSIESDAIVNKLFAYEAVDCTKLRSIISNLGIENDYRAYLLESITRKVQSDHPSAVDLVSVYKEVSKMALAGVEFDIGYFISDSFIREGIDISIISCIVRSSDYRVIFASARPTITKLFCCLPNSILNKVFVSYAIKTRQAIKMNYNARALVAPEQLDELEKFIVDMRARKPLLEEASAFRDRLVAINY